MAEEAARLERYRTRQSGAPSRRSRRQGKPKPEPKPEPLPRCWLCEEVIRSRDLVELSNALFAMELCWPHFQEQRDQRDRRVSQ
jgi:hypothetical protein